MFRFLINGCNITLNATAVMKYQSLERHISLNNTAIHKTLHF